MIMNFIAQEFNGIASARFYGITIPDLKTMSDYAKWLAKDYVEALDQTIERYTSYISKARSDKDKKALVDYGQQKAAVVRKRCRLYRFLAPFADNPKQIEDHWVMNKEYKKGAWNLEFKPIEVSQFAEEHLFYYGERILMMSATILDKEAFFKSLRVNPDDCEFIRTDSPFAPETREVQIVPVAKLSAKTKDKALPKITEVVEMIINELHPDEKGIIHTHSYEIQQYLMENIKTDRFVFHTAGNREEQLDYHKLVKKPTILVSPSMYEGVDLKDEMSRFQIVIKMPFPYLGDKQVAAKKERFKGWYEHQTAVALIQSFGRSTRNEKDYSTTYVLDANFVWFYENNRNLFPDWLNINFG
jgi:Rad3-related DNA helicase